MAEQRDDQSHQEYIWILGFAGEDDDGGTERGRFFRRDEARMGRRRVPAEQLQQNVEAFVRAMGRVIIGAPSVLSGYSIDSIEINAEVSASGKVSLLGNGGELAGKGGIAFTLTRLKVDEPEKRPAAATKPQE
jgi:hypothetical protein